MNSWTAFKKFVVAVVFGFIVGKVQQLNHSCNQGPLITPFAKLKPKQNQRFIYVGVMTTTEFLATRGVELWKSWGHKLDGSIEFYVGGRNMSGDNRRILLEMEQKLPFHILSNVDDASYPPQKKSFYMVNHMIKTKLTDYKWFLRSDDDLFVDTDRLVDFLRRVNETNAHLLGSPGEGNDADFLDKNQMYCMGGPGMIFSRGLLSKLNGTLTECLTHLKTNHEDVELSRCVRYKTGINSCGRR